MIDKIMSAEEYYLNDRSKLKMSGLQMTANGIFKFATDYATYVSEIREKKAFVQGYKFGEHDGKNKFKPSGARGTTVEYVYDVNSAWDEYQQYKINKQ
jgi:hypothetical protein